MPKRSTFEVISSVVRLKLNFPLKKRWQVNLTEVMHFIHAKIHRHWPELIECLQVFAISAYYLPNGSMGKCVGEADGDAHIQQTPERLGHD